MSIGQISAALKRGGRQRNIERRAREIQDALRHRAARRSRTDRRTRSQRRPPPRSGSSPSSTARSPNSSRSLTDRFEQHPDADIYRSLPGLGVILGARALGEFGDDPDRYANTKSRKNYAGTSPLTVASGKKRAVLARHIRNRRLYDAIDQWAFCSLSNSAGCRRLLRPTTRRRRPAPPSPPRSATASSASSTAASTTEPTTTNTPPGHTDTKPTINKPLDTFRPWGV